MSVDAPATIPAALSDDTGLPPGTPVPANHLDALIRQTRQHHVQLSALADRKAGMLLTLSSVVATIALPQLTHPQFKYAIGTLMVSCLITLLLACYVVMPKLSLKPRLIGTGGQDGNPLFFADFHHLSFEQYRADMHRILNDPEQIYDVQIKEIWQLGQYLAKKKYRVLRYAYLAFLSGFLIAGAEILIGLYAFG